VIRALIFSLVAVLVLASDALAGKYDDLLSVSVRVEIGRGCGTGVLVTRADGERTRTFVWTAGHVVESLRHDGKFDNSIIYFEYRDKGRLIGSGRIEAKVIAYSAPDSGEDLALLEILQDNWAPVIRSAKFYLKDEIPEIGVKLVHVGCTMGLYDSLSFGVLSQTERDIMGKVFDQTSCMGYPGSSGGGVYLDETHECIGLLTRGVGPGLNFIIPMRRIIPWAKKMGVLWALDLSVSMPNEEARAKLPVDDGTATDYQNPMQIIISIGPGDEEPIVVPEEPGDEEPIVVPEEPGDEEPRIEGPSPSIGIPLLAQIPAESDMGEIVRPFRVLHTT